MSRPASPFLRVWGAPLVLGVAMLVSLVAALVEDGLWDIIAAAVLFAALGYALRKGMQVA